MDTHPLLSRNDLRIDKICNLSPSSGEAERDLAGYYQLEKSRLKFVCPERSDEQIATPEVLIADQTGLAAPPPSQ